MMAALMAVKVNFLEVPAAEKVYVRPFGGWFVVTLEQVGEVADTIISYHKHPGEAEAAGYAFLRRKYGITEQEQATLPDSGGGREDDAAYWRQRALRTERLLEAASCEAIG